MKTVLRIISCCALFWLASDTALARGPWRASEQNTRGWQLMTPEERIAHQAKIREFRDYDACHAYQVEHHRQLAARARAQSISLPEARRDACSHLPPASDTQ